MAERRSDPRQRLPFAATYPPSEELDELLDAFERGDYGRVRVGAPALASRTDDAEVAAAARDLRRRIGADPTSVYLLAIAFGLLIVLMIHYVMERS